MELLVPIAVSTDVGHLQRGGDLGQDEPGHHLAHLRFRPSINGAWEVFSPVAGGFEVVPDQLFPFGVGEFGGDD